MSSKHYALSVVIPTFNAGPWLREQLEALQVQRDAVDFEVIVADNGSDDGTSAVALEFADRLPMRVIDASARRGQCFARNEGARVARADALVFLDQDDVVEPGYLAAMRSALEQHAMVAARIDHESLNPGWISSSRRPAQVRSLGSALGFLPYAGGQTIGIRKSLFDAIGGFDESMPGAVEDVDLCWRAQLAGGDLFYAPDAVVQYRYRPTLGAQMRQAFAYGQAEVTLYHRYRSRGMKRRTVAAATKSWIVVCRGLLIGRNKEALAKVAWRMAHDLGMAERSVRLRVFYP